MPRKPKQEHIPDNDQQWQQAWEQPGPINPTSKKALLENIHRQLDKGQRSKKKFYLIGLSAAAAAILVTVFISLPGRQPEVPVIAWQELTSSDSIRQVKLADGSILHMAPHSTVRVHPDFINKRSSLLVKGRIFFSVAKDSLHPFSIGVNHQQVTVLGTQFTINRIDTTDLQLTVREGKVALDNSYGRNILVKGQQIITLNGKPDTVRTVNPLIADWWKQGQVRLLNISMATLIDCIESYYGIHLSHGPVNPFLKLTLTWDMTVSLKENLTVLNALTGYNIH